MVQNRNDKCFRVLDSPPRGAAEHMALDEVIMQAHSENLVPNTLRFLQFKPCALVGLHQNTCLEVNVPYCRANGIEINRRITGGGSLYWGPLELGYELYAAKSTPGIPADVAGLYRLMCEGTALGLQKLGLRAAYRPVNDIEINGRKIAGTGGTELGGTFVFQCSLLVDFDVEEMLRVLRLPVEKLGDKAAKTFRERVTTMSAELGRVPDHADIKTAVLDGLRISFGYEFNHGELTAAELALYEQVLPQFRSEEWIFGKNGGVMATVDAFAAHKAPGGLIRVHVRLDDKINRIRQIIITGDFFAYPRRTVNDLENALKNTAADGDSVAAAINAFFREHRPDIPGVSAQHVIAAVEAAIGKAREKARPFAKGQGGSAGG